MKKRRLKKSVIKKGIILILVIIIIIIIRIMVGIIKYHKTDEYHLLKIGYNKEQVDVILTNNEATKYALEHEYQEYVSDFMQEKYYIGNNLERYIEYKNNNQNKELKDVVSIVNVSADYSWYTNTKPSDTTKKELILVNKYNYVDKDYILENAGSISARYAYSDNLSNDKMLSYYKKLFDAAEKDNMHLVISSAYRPYNEQEETYNYYKNTKGKEYAEKYAAHAGYSEHQTGLAFDILTLDSDIDTFEKTSEFKWLKENAYKYGFILRYPSGKEYLTGYNYEPWHYRYVGEKVAKKIHDEDITFDEYYAFYIENK